MRDPLDDGYAKLLAERRNVLIAHATVRLRVLLERERGRAPLLEELGQCVRRLAPDHEQPRVQPVQRAVQVL